MVMWPTSTVAAAAREGASVTSVAAFTHHRVVSPAAPLARVPPILVGPLDLGGSAGAAAVPMAMAPSSQSFRQRRRPVTSGSRSPPHVRREMMKLEDATEEASSSAEGGGDPTDVDVGLHRRRGDSVVDVRSPASDGVPSAVSSSNDDEAPEIESGGEDARPWLTGLSAEAVVLLNLVAVIWGTQHSVIKTVVDDCDASAFSFARFGLGALLASPYTPPIGPALRRLTGGGGSMNASLGESKKEDDEEVGDSSTAAALAISGESSTNTDADAIVAWRWGLEMGAWMFLGYAFQAVGLAFTTAQRSGFLLYLNVKFVPFFARILFGKDISVATWASAFTALAGTALVSYDGSDLSLNVGDLWSVAAAAASAMFILRLESASGAVKDSSALNAASLWVVAAASLVWTIGQGVTSPPSPNLGAMGASRAMVDSIVQTVVLHPFALIYLGGVTTALANYIQTKAQKDISAERASIIYAMDPVYGAVFASLFLGESLNSYGIAGAGLITLAAATNAFLDLGPGKTNSEEHKNEKT